MNKTTNKNPSGTDFHASPEGVRRRDASNNGLAGIIAGRSAICTVEAAGDSLFYRGYSINDLAEQACFEEVAHLLIHGELPDAKTLAAYRAKLKGLRGLPGPLKTILEQTGLFAVDVDKPRQGSGHVIIQSGLCRIRCRCAGLRWR